MTEAGLNQLKYPVGKFTFDPAADVNAFILTIIDFPGKIRHETEQLTVHQLDTPYRPDGWTIRQVIHHCADSHQNAFARFKLALTEDTPVIKPYRENLWAVQPDYHEPIQPSLLILEGVHHRWAALLNSMNETDFEQQYMHPEYNRKFTLREALGLYDWHCRHHLAHITELKKREGW
ncbi:MAG: putative metal-dependent hydrolase [Bacteroidetes bacterium]|nr:putative metal-dependent hydrolase [Bacteroidota bacterium]